MGSIKHKALINVDLGEGYGNLKCVRHLYAQEPNCVLIAAPGTRQGTPSLHLARQCGLRFPLWRSTHYDGHCAPLQIP